MARVIQCDACKKVDEATRTFCLEVCKGTPHPHASTTTVLKVDICKDCYDKVLQVLSLEVVKKC